MRINWIYTLLILLFIFGILYIMGTFFGNQSELIQIWITPMTDLWANLFASIVIIVFIERIIHQIRIEKNQQSITYVKGRIARTLIRLIFSAKAPSNWRDNLTNPKFNWQKYVQKIRSSRSHALEELENIIDRYSFLLEPELMNDIFILGSILRNPIYDLSDATMYSVALISKSKNLIECHELLKYIGTTIIFKKGELPKVSLGKRKIGITDQNQYRHYSDWLEEAIAFRDEQREKLGI